MCVLGHLRRTSFEHATSTNGRAPARVNGVYAAQIGASSIKRLLGIGVQPIIVDVGHDIHDLLNEVSLAMFHGGLSWVERAAAKARETAPKGVSQTTNATGQRLITSIEELDSAE